jgi:DNA mismatch repair protein MutL
MYKELFGKEPYGGRQKVEETPKKEENYYTIDAKIEDSNVSLFEDNEEYSKPLYKFIGIAFNTYIILEIDNELYIMDQHAAHERIMYEKVKENFYQAGEKESQMLLLPDVITLSHKEMDIAKDNMALFRQAGFMLEEFGENTIKLSGVPEVCVDLDTSELFKETLDEINTVARTAKQEKEEKFIATVACKAAVKANMKLTTEEVENLMNELLKLPNPFTCPYGRPTVIKMSKYEIERKFARK